MCESNSIHATGNRSLLLSCLVLTVAGVAVYANSFAGAFLFDDIPLIVENSALVGGEPIWDLLSRRRPVVWLSLALNHALSGLDIWSYHAFNLSVHILASSVLFGLVRRTLNRKEFRGHLGPDAHWLALIVAVIWLVHPLQTQVVTYIIQRAEALMGLFCLCTLYCVLRGSEGRRPFCWYAAAVAACFLGMASKPTMIIAPFVVFLFDWVFLSDRSRPITEAPESNGRVSFGSRLAVMFRRRWGLYLGLFASWILPLTSGVVRGLVQTGGKQTTVGLSVGTASPLEYAQTQTEVVLHYIRLAVWPGPLCLDYDWPIVKDFGSVVGSTIVIAVLLVGTSWLVFRRSWLGFAGAWFFLVLAPTSSVIPIQDAAVEHRMYLPLAGVVLLVVVTSWWAMDAFARRFHVAHRGRLFMGALLASIVATGLGLTSMLRNKDYRTPVAMWTDVVAKRPNNPRGHYNLGKSYNEIGRGDQAIEEYQHAIRVDPFYYLAYYGLGHNWGQLGRRDLSIRAYRRAIALRPEHASMRNSLANALVANGQTEEAIREYETAMRIDPGHVLTHYNLGTTFLELGRYAEAIDVFKETVRLAPTHVKTLRNLGVSLGRVGRFEEAVSTYWSALSIDPHHATTYVNLGRALLALGRVNEAQAAFRRALEIDPDHVYAKNALDGI